MSDLHAGFSRFGRSADMGQVALVLSRQLDEPLSAAADYLSGGVRSLEGGDCGPALQAMRRAREQVARAEEIIQGLQAFAGKDGTERRIEDLVEVIEEAGARLQIPARGETVTFAVIHGAGPSRVLGDRFQLQQVLLSLMTQSVDAMANRQRRAISVVTRALPGHMVEVLVACTGSDLTVGEGRASSRSGVIAKSTATDFDLGLCRSIIESHGGRLWAEDTPGGGGAFHVVLPTVRPGPQFDCR